MYCHTFVSPGIGATLQTYRYTNKKKSEKIAKKFHDFHLVQKGLKGKRLTDLERNVLITDDFPTLGYPTNPTDMACLSFFKRANCRNTERRDPWKWFEGMSAHCSGAEQTYSLHPNLGGALVLS
jgi:hypothetical protein